MASLGYAQSDRFAYAVTDVAKEGFNWSVIRRIDLQNNTYSEVLFNGADMNQALYDATSKKQLAPLTDALYGKLANAAFGTGVAALAYDKKNNRLWYTPMFIDQLRFIDLKTMQVSVLNGNFAGTGAKASDQSNILTRMVIGNDGNGYALSNDGKTFLRFTAGKKGISVTNLGSLVDAPENKDVSIYNSCTSYGGDIVADDNNNLYIFSARNHVFSVNIETKVATHLGMVTGLPAGFSMNGAAVTPENKILLTSATDNSGLYLLDISTLVATQAPAAATPWRTSDLANGNILRSGKKDFDNAPDLFVKQKPVNDAGLVDIYPNPVTTDRQFALQFKKTEAGSYTVQVIDANGRQLVQQVIRVSGKGQTENLRLPAITTSGIYLVKVTDQSKKVIFTDKLMVQ